jgi:hypothetical protein
MRKLALLIVLALCVVPAALADTSPSASSPAQRCAAQRTGMGTSAFNQLYGTNASDQNAFGKCVSKLALSNEQNQTNASQACKAERSDANFAANHAGKTFAQFYGTNANGRNAYGNCVSKKAQAAGHAQDQTTINAARSCRTEQKADPVAFKNKYGTNANKSNAFGKCVSQEARA